MPPLRHALFLVREERIVRSAGFRKWVPIAKSADESIQTIQKAGRDAPSVYIIDVDGVEAGAPNHVFHQRLERAYVQPWLESGARGAEDVMDAFFAGAQEVTIGLRHMGEDKLRELAELSEGEFHLGLDFSRSGPEPGLRAFEIQRLVSETGAGGVVVHASSETDWHRLEAWTRDVRGHRIPCSLVLEHVTPWRGKALAGESFDHVMIPPGSD